MATELENIKKYVRAANYLSAAQIFLNNNFLLENKLSFDDIKPRLLGHWGTCPGINFVYANLNYLIKKHSANFMFVLGPGHGFPALQANLYIEGTLGKYYPETAWNTQGSPSTAAKAGQASSGTNISDSKTPYGSLAYLVKNFSWPYGFPSHSNPGAPGVILEGGELGYSLSTSYGAILDNPDLIVACLVGDGEAETGPTATAWHLNKFIDPATNGAVLPILHLNGYKISGPTIFGRMTNRELKSLFYGYGYEPILVDGTGDKIYEKMAAAMETSYQKIRAIQTAARGNTREAGTPRFPMLILRTPKGWTGIKKLHGQKIEGNCLAHQVVATNAKTDRSELRAVEKWLTSYNFNELFNAESVHGEPAESGFSQDVKDLIPPANLRMGENNHAFGGRDTAKNLTLPEATQFAEDATVPGTVGSSSMRRAGLFLNEVFKLNAENKNFRLFSPDETYSNKLDEVFKTTARAFAAPIKEWDKDLKPDGRVMEMLSEHSLQGMMQGYILTGRHAVFASYEAFIQIISSMTDQYAKFLKVAAEIPWRKAVPSLNFILTSSGWRQEHNGFSHQNPGFIDNILQHHGCFTHVYFPADGNTTLAVLKKCLASQNGINVIAAGKTQEPRWLTPELAEKEMERGLMIWDFASDENPDIVIGAAGDYLTKEALAAISIIKKEAPEIKLRFVNVLELCEMGVGNTECRAPYHDFYDYFTADKPVIFNFHGYPETLKQILFDVKGCAARFSIHGYIENGSTTTPFDMQVRNKTSRWHLAVEAFGKADAAGKISKEKADGLIKKYTDKFSEHGAYIRKHGVDMAEVEEWKWPAGKA